MKKIENLFLSVGAMKAGTTWLYEQLKNHPDIYFTPEKEIHYFANKIGIEHQLNQRNRIIKLKNILTKYHKGNPSYLSKHLNEIHWYSIYANTKDINNNWYINLFSLKENQKFCADFSNLYCQMETNGWENVRKVSKNIKVIYTLRDPMKRLWSHYKFHMKWINMEDKALDMGFQHFKNLLNQHFFWINAEYFKNYQLLNNSLNKDELMVLYFEDFRENPEKMLKEVQNFLGIKNIPIDTASANKKINATKDFKLPEEWEDYMKNKLQPIYMELEKNNLLHHSWKIP